MLKVTLDTNLLPADDLVASVPAERFEFAVVSVTDREMDGASQLATPTDAPRIPETMVWGESPWGSALWGDSKSSDCLERTLTVISEGSFPLAHQRAALTNGQRRQLRDAMIFCAHVREKRAVFVTNDKRGFIRKDRRAKLEEMFDTRILTRQEFLAEFGAK